jgi:hypothetical protein
LASHTGEDIIEVKIVDSATVEAEAGSVVKAGPRRGPRAGLTTGPHRAVAGDSRADFTSLLLP